MTALPDVGIVELGIRKLYRKRFFVWNFGRDGIAARSTRHSADQIDGHQ
jgi:hypothetical protein